MLDADDRAIVGDTEEEVSALRVEKGGDGLEDRLSDRLVVLLTVL